MAWDSSRPVPWMRLVKDWALYAGVMTVIFLIVMRDDLSLGTFVGLFASLPLYLLFGGVFAKFGYVRKTMKDMRDAAAQERAQRATSAATTTPAGRPKPPPTKRTSTGPSNHKRKR